jgi:chemotaxis protein histidine kinase CheA
LQIGLQNVATVPHNKGKDCIAEEQGKLVHFVVKGSHELVDRIYLECLKVPLAQLLKNAVDHGIEKPEERALKGNS